MLTKELQIKVKVNKAFSKFFKTTVGILQGDALSPILFILYLAVSLKEEDLIEEILLRPKYEDDITYAAMKKETIEKVKKEVHPCIKEGKTEEFEIPSPHHHHQHDLRLKH